MTNNDIMAAVIPAICSQLKCPASAQFPPEFVSIIGDDFNGYQVFGYVDSQNSYGAMMRNDFSATVISQNGYPIVTSANVGVRANAQRAKEFGTNYIVLSIITAIGGFILYLLISALVGL